MTIVLFQCQNHENHESHIIPLENHKNHENHRIPCDNHESMKIIEVHKRENVKS